MSLDKIGSGFKKINERNSPMSEFELDDITDKVNGLIALSNPSSVELPKKKMDAIGELRKMLAQDQSKNVLE